jgi:peroxiredoxin
VSDPHGLDPERAAKERAAQRPERPEPVIDTRPYRWAIGVLGIAIVAILSVVSFAHFGVGTTGITPGNKLHYFVAPLVSGNVDLPASTNPKCNPAHPNRQGLNVCGRAPIVLAFFVTGSDDCKRQVDALQTVSREFSPSQVQFAAVAVKTSKSDAAAVVRSHHWTIPIGFDPDGRVGEIYGVSLCPLVQLARRGGIVTDRLIGNNWLKPYKLAARVRALIGQ